MLYRVCGGVHHAPPGPGEDETAGAEVKAWRPPPLQWRMGLHAQDAVC